MAAPDVNYRSRDVFWLLSGAVGILLFLQILRPHYFLTDDNMTGLLPLMREIGRRLWHLQNPLWNPWLYGGFDVRTDASTIMFFNPPALLCSLLAVTELAVWMPDILCSVYFIMTALAFYNLTRDVRESYAVDIKPGVSIVLSLSYSFSMYGLIVGSSWLNFVSSQAGVALLASGLLTRRKRKSWICLMAGAYVALFCGYPHPFLYGCVFLSLMALALACIEKRYDLLLRWAVVHVVLLLLALPFVLPGYTAVHHSSRGDSVGVLEASEGALSLPHQIGSLLAGPAFLCSSIYPGFFNLQPGYGWLWMFSGMSFVLLWILARFSTEWKTSQLFGGLLLAVLIYFKTGYGTLAFAGLVLMIFGFGLIRWWKNSHVTPLEKVLILLLVATILFVHRPRWLGEILYRIPVYKYLRWPFREILYANLFVHMLLCFGQRFVKTREFVLCAGAAAVMLVLCLVRYGSPSFNLMSTDRRLMISGQAEQWWRENMKDLDDGRKWVSVMDVRDFCRLRFDTPFSLLGAYNYASFFEVPGQAGYWSNYTIPKTGVLSRLNPYHWSGLISPEGYQKLIDSGMTLNSVTLVVGKEGLVTVLARSSRGSRSLVVEGLKPGPMQEKNW